MPALAPAQISQRLLMAVLFGALIGLISRVAQGVLTGVGFLGAGVILRDPGDGRVHGLTTAAAIWVTALFGVACGAGAYQEVGLGFVLVLLVLWLGGPIEQLVRQVLGQPDADG